MPLRKAERPRRQSPARTLAVSGGALARQRPPPRSVSRELASCTCTEQAGGRASLTWYRLQVCRVGSCASVGVSDWVQGLNHCISGVVRETQEGTNIIY